ncbi:MAG: EB domain-containing protein, partial [Myxococcota bacterium]|nr:EB domain-containing protein [Myxococcota bacterium]
MYRWWMLGGLTMAVAAGACSEPPRSHIGESCTRTADCVEGARCINHTCVAPEEQRDEEGAAPTDKAPTRGDAPTKKTAAKPAAASHCQTADKLAGFWGWTSTVVGGHSPKSVGVNGHYQMTVTALDCKVKVELKKTGFNKRTWGPDKLFTGEAVFGLEPLAGFGAQAVGAINLTSQKGSSSEMTLTLVPDNDLLWGFWSYEGASWESGGMWGAIKGKRDSTDRLKYRAWTDQPCAIQCALGCEVPRRRKEGGMAGAPYDACTRSCADTPRATPTLCKPRGTTLAPEDVGFRDKRQGWGWSDRCFNHLKADRLGFAMSACDKGIAFATKIAGADATGPERAQKALGALNYNMGAIFERRGNKKRARNYYVKALWWTEGRNTTAAQKA